MAGEQNSFFEHTATAMEPLIPETRGSAQSASKNVEIEGQVHVKRDAHGQIVAVTIQAGNGDTYTVRLRGQGRMLATADGKSVQLKGKARGKGGENILVVQSFQILP